MEKEYQVRFYQDNLYGVYEVIDNDFWPMVFCGSLSDCEAYIRLHEGGYM